MSYYSSEEEGRLQEEAEGFVDPETGLLEPPPWYQEEEDDRDPEDEGYHGPDTWEEHWGLR